MNFVPEPEKLLEFLEREASVFGTLSEVRHTFRKLGPLVLKAQTGRYDLGKNSRRFREQAERAITGVTGESVSGIDIVRLSKPTAIPPTMITEPDCIIDMRCAIHYDRASRLEYLFNRHIWQPLTFTIWDDIGKLIWLKIGSVSWSGAIRLNRLATLLYVGYSLAGARGKMHKLSRWVELLYSSYPLGQLQADPSRWLLVTR
jgi:hypothetical protein